jgi:ZIP family zinc transporter
MTGMLTAVLFGLAASSALVIGAVAGSLWRPPRRVTGVLLAFASGALISALAFELFEEAFHLGGALRSGLGLLAGAATFVLVDSALDRYVTGDPGAEQVRTYGAWYRHVTLAMLAHAFLAVTAKTQKGAPQTPMTA